MYEEVNKIKSRDAIDHACLNQASVAAAMSKQAAQQFREDMQKMERRLDG